MEGVCEAPEDPKREEPGAEADGVEKRKDEELEDEKDADGVLNMENPDPDEAAGKVPGVDCVACDIPEKADAGAGELVNKPATCVEGCENADTCKAG
eukprot:Gb_35849 [translate_table: standard]